VLNTWKVRLAVGAGCAALACAAGAAPAGAVTTTQTKSCSVQGLVHPILFPPPSCTTDAVAFPDGFTGAGTYSVTGTGRSLLGNAAVRLENIINGLGPFAITNGTCGPTPNTCTAHFATSGNLVNITPDRVKLRCSWNTLQLSLVSITNCTETLTLTPAPITAG
jgi:hypothetical protein